MTDAERMLLEDAIQTAIEGEKRHLIEKRIVYISIWLNVVLAGIIGILMWRLYG